MHGVKGSMLLGAAFWLLVYSRQVADDLAVLYACLGFGFIAIAIGAFADERS